MENRKCIKAIHYINIILSKIPITKSTRYAYAYIIYIFVSIIVPIHIELDFGVQTIVITLQIVN